MPSEPMKQRVIRVGDDLWEPAATIASKHRTDLSKVIRSKLAEYVTENGGIVPPGSH